MLAKLFKVTLLTLLTYLLQATVAAHIALWDIAPNMALALIAIVSIGLGRKYTFFMALAIGYLLEIMLPMMDYMNLILYPVCSLLGSLMFSDKSERRLEEERSTGRRAITLHAHLRTPLCAAVSVLVFEAVHLTYIYLSGVTIDSGHISRALIDVLYSAAIAGVMQFPIRWWLGIYKLKKLR